MDTMIPIYHQKFRFEGILKQCCSEYFVTVSGIN